MWKIALGLVVFLQTGGLLAAEGEQEQEKAGKVECPPNEACDQDEVVEPTPPTVPPAAVPPVAPVAVAPARDAFATVNFRNDVSAKLRLVEARFTMDGNDLPTVLTSPEPGKSYVVVSGPMKPGAHYVTARLTYQGERRVFTYMNGYKLKVSSNQVVTAPENRTVSFTVVGAENKGMTVPLDKRVVVKVEENAPKK